MIAKVVFLVVFMVGMISSHIFLHRNAEDKKNFDIDNDGDLLIMSSANTNKEIEHHDIYHEPLELMRNVDGILHYSIGARTRNDRLVASGGQNQSWAAPHNVNIQLTYPSQGYGAAVTYVAIVVNQTSNLGKAYVVRGGINQHMISISVEAYNTYVFNVFAYVYGI